MVTSIYEWLTDTDFEISRLKRKSENVKEFPPAKVRYTLFIIAYPCVKISAVVADDWNETLHNIYLRI